MALWQGRCWPSVHHAFHPRQGSLDQPQGGLRQLKLIPDVLRTNPCFPEIGRNLSSLENVLPLGMLTTCRVNQRWYFAVWYFCLNILPKRQFPVQVSEIMHDIVHLEVHSNTQKKITGHQHTQESCNNELMTAQFHSSQLYTDSRQSCQHFRTIQLLNAVSSKPLHNTFPQCSLFKPSTQYTYSMQTLQNLYTC